MLFSMGKLVNGRWTNEWYGSDEKGEFVREDTVFRRRVTRDGSSGFAAEPGRYHLYVSLACPWAHRAIIARRLKGLESVISMDVVHPHMGEDGWTFAEFPAATGDSVNHARYLREIYTLAKADYTGRVTVPVLWDKRERTVVCNDSRMVLRMLSREFDSFASQDVELCPARLEADIDREIEQLYKPVNNGVYRAGFATKQSAYESAVRELFQALDAYEVRLARQRFLFGQSLTEADICLFTTLVRFEPVYHFHFKCNLRRLRDYPALWGFVRDVYQLPGLAEVVSFDHIKHHYYTSHPQLNPGGIVPLGPELSLDDPSRRAEL